MLHARPGFPLHNDESGRRPFRGIPIQLITAGLMAMGLMGFYGLHLSQT